ncbi:MAG: translocation/assembly module TamB domain-containing protein [Desulfobaccales bacterium]
MRLLKVTLIAVLLLLLMGIAASWALLSSDFFWRRAGAKAVALAQEHLKGQLQVGEIAGNLFDGLFFKDITLKTPEEEIFQAQSLEIRLSLWSLVELKPVIGRLALVKPRLSLRQAQEGGWNIAALLGPAASPAPEEAPLRLWVPIHSVKFQQILIIDGEVEIKRKVESLQIKNLDLDLALRVDDPLGPEQIIAADKVMAAALTPSGRVVFSGRFTFGNKAFDIPLLELKTGQQTLLSLRGKGDLKEGGEIQAAGKVTLAATDLQNLWSKWPAGADVAAAVTLKGTLAQIRLHLEGTFREGAFQLTGLVGQTGETWQYDLNGALKNLGPDLLALYDVALAKKVRDLSPFNLTLQVQGTGLAFPPAQLAWKVESGPWQYGAVKGEGLQVSLTGDRHRQSLQGSVKSNIGNLSLSAQGALLSGAQGKFTLKVDSLNPEFLGPEVPRGTKVTGKLDGTFTAPGWGALDRVKLSGTIEAGGQIGPHPLKTQGRLAWQENKLEIPQADLRMGNLNLTLKGTLVGDSLNFTHQGKSGSGGSWPIPAHLGGQFVWEGTLRGTAANPDVALKAWGRGLSYDQFRVQTFSLNAQASGQPPSRGQVTIQASGLRTPAGLFSEANLIAAGENRTWTFDFKTSGPEATAVEVRGRAHLGIPALSLERLYLRNKRVRVHNLGPMEINLSSGLEIKPVILQINQGRVSLQAALTDRQASGQLDFQDLEAAWFAPAGFPLQGIISGQAALSGEPRRPEIQGLINLKGGRYQEIEFQSGRTTLIYRDERLTLVGSLNTKKAGPTLSWDGYLPMRLTLWPFASVLVENGLRLSLRGDNVNLSLLPAFTKEVESAQGAVKLQALIEGAITRPQVSGQVSWGPGSLKLRQAGADYQLQPGEFRLQGNRITIPKLTLASQGTATLDGDLTLAGFLPDEVKAKLRLDNFKAIDKLGSEVVVNGALNLTGRWPDLAVKGNLLLPQASFRLSFFNMGPSTVNKDVILVRQKTPETPKSPKPQPSPEPEVWKNLQVDLAVQAPKNVWVNDRAAKIEAAVDVRLKKQPGQKLMSRGKIQALQGQVFIVGREFQVTKGIIHLPPQAGAEPQVDARIEYDTSEVTLFADVSGPASNPKIDLRGEPPITETDWLSYLLYGKPVAALSQKEQGAAMAAGAFGGLATKMILRDFLGMVPPLTKGLTITYQHRNDPLYRDDPYQVVIQYRISRRFSIQSQVGGRNTGGDVLFNYDF